jgi:two-component system alkaline phosphatase synthesis response regulator PhoP
METILIVEDDRSIIKGIEKNLQYEGYNVLTAMDGERGLELAVNKKPDLIVLDIMLPKVNGFEICKTLKKHEINTPIIIISAKNQEVDKIMGLDLGADDYIAKPFSLRELLARINAVLRRIRKTDEGVENFTFGKVEVDYAGQTVKVKGRPQEVSTREFKLLKFLIDNEGRVLDRQTILNKVWGFDYYGTSRTIDNFITKLRQKIEDDPENPDYILTVRGTGYKFVSGKKK